MTDNTHWLQHRLRRYMELLDAQSAEIRRLRLQLAELQEEGKGSQ